MDLQSMRRAITVEEYHHMGDAGVFLEDEHLELIEGEIIAMTPIGIRTDHNRRTLQDYPWLTA